MGHKNQKSNLLLAPTNAPALPPLSFDRSFVEGTNQISLNRFVTFFGPQIWSHPPPPLPFPLPALLLPHTRSVVPRQTYMKSSVTVVCL